MKHLSNFIISIILITCYGSSFGQSRWVHSYLDNEDVYLKNILESYDKGYLISGKYGANYSKYNWLIKTDVNGDVLWEKTIGNGLNAIALHDIDQDESGNIYLGGSTNAYDPDGDPLIMKLNSCGEKEWCRIIYKENHYSFASCLTLTPNNDVVAALYQINSEPWVDRICLAKLSAGGELIWKYCYTSADTSQQNEDIYDIILTPDLGFLLTGFCYYEDPEIPDHWVIHPYILKIDSLGNFQWETVVFKETNTDGGWAVSTVVSPDQNYFYSSGSHYHFDSVLTASPALMKMNMVGNIIAAYDLVEGHKYGALNYAQFTNDSTLAAEAGWANTEDENWSLAVIIDTLGNLLNSTVLVEDSYTSHLDFTYDGKLVYASNTYQNGQFDCFLTKLNQDLGQDTIYTMPFTYDSLCPYQIVSDTIVQDDCGLIVGVPDDRTIGRYEGMTVRMEVWPNPAREWISLTFPDIIAPGKVELVVFNVFGQEVIKETAMPFNRISSLNISALSPGIYFVRSKDQRNRLYTGKFVVGR